VATPAQLLAEMAAAVETLTGAARQASDYRDDLEALADGATVYQLRGGPSGEDSGRSDGPRTVLAVELLVKHRLAGAERAYTEGDMQTYVAALIAPAFWRTLPSAVDVVENPTYAIERVGRNVTVTVTLELSVAL